MATQTLTCSEVTPLKASPRAPNYVPSRLKVLPATSLSVNDIILLARLPNGATLYDWVLAGGCSGAVAAKPGTSTGFQVGCKTADGVVDAISGKSITASSLHANAILGTSGISGSRFLNTPFSISASLIEAPVYPGFCIPFKLSLSDGATPQWVWIQAIAGSSMTGTTTLNFSMIYTVGDSSSG